MNKITRKNIKNSNKFTETEKIVLDHMLKWEEWNKSQGRKNEDAFIVSNESGLIEIKASILFEAIYHLVDLGILKKRNCDAIAYEWDNRMALENYL